jgi:hypothetical protein
MIDSDTKKLVIHNMRYPRIFRRILSLLAVDTANEIKTIPNKSWICNGGVNKIGE